MWPETGFKVVVLGNDHVVAGISFPPPLLKAEMRESPAVGCLSESRMWRTHALGGVTLRKEAGGGNASTRRQGDLVTTQVSQLTGSISLWVHWAWLSCATARVHHETVVSGEGQALQSELLSWHILPSSLSLETVQPRSLPGSGSGHSTSPEHPGKR